MVLGVGVVPSELKLSEPVVVVVPSAGRLPLSLTASVACVAMLDEIGVDSAPICALTLMLPLVAFFAPAAVWALVELKEQAARCRPSRPLPVESTRRPVRSNRYVQ